MNEFTIIITSFNRPKCLLRNLKFLLSYNLCFKIIIADSSNNIDKNEELKILIKDHDILFKKFSQNIKVAQKISEVLKFVSTKYCVLCADDDFIIPISIIKCIDFLKNNVDYACCHGKYYIHTPLKHINNFGIVFRDQTPILISSEEDTSIKRVNTFTDEDNLAAQYPFYAVFETTNLKIIWDQTVIYANDWFFNEYFSTIVALLVGKMKTLPIFYMSREPNSYNWHDKKKIKNIFTKQSKMTCSEGVATNLIKYSPDLDFEAIKKKYFNVLGKKKQRMIRKLVTTNNYTQININRDNILKHCLRGFFYLYLRIIFKLSNKLTSSTVRKIESLIVESGDTINEVNDSRKQY